MKSVAVEHKHFFHRKFQKEEEILTNLAYKMNKL